MAPSPPRFSGGERVFSKKSKRDRPNAADTRLFCPAPPHLWRQGFAQPGSGCPRPRILVKTYALNHTPTIGCRTLDVLHVAAAKLTGTTEFCTFDTRQFTLAGQIGLAAVTP